MTFGSIKTGRLTSLESGHYPQVQSGLDASKTVSPGVGDTYYATETGKIYTCFISGTWTLTSSVSVERYSNHLGTVDNIMSTSVFGNGTASTSSHQMDLSSGVGLASFASYKTNIGINPDTDYFVFNAKAQNIVNGATGIRWSMVGLMLEEVTDNGVYFMQDETNAWTVRTIWVTENKTTSIPALVNGDRLTIIGQKNRCVFLVNGLVVAVHVAQVSAFTFYPFFVVRDNVAEATVARQISCDYIDIEVMK